MTLGALFAAPALNRRLGPVLGLAIGLAAAVCAASWVVSRLLLGVVVG
jgi:hypothetical protein